MVECLVVQMFALCSDTTFAEIITKRIKYSIFRHSLQGRNTTILSPRVVTKFKILRRLLIKS